MPNSILNLKMALYSSDKIGAVGAVTNKATNDQKIEAKCKSFKEYVEFACKNNISGSHTYKEKSDLSTFAILIKSEVLKKVGLLDEKFITSKVLEGDTSFTIPMQEYKMISAGDSFIFRL